MTQLAAITLEPTTPSIVRWRRIGLSCLLTLFAQVLVALMLIWLYSAQPEHPPVTAAFAQELENANPSLLRDDLWQNIKLPDKLCRSDCKHRYKAYRLLIPTPNDKTSQALYVRMFDGSMSAYLNGNRIGQSGSMREPIADMTYHPAYFDLPGSLWTDEVNELDIIVASLVEAGGRLTPPFVGDATPLRQAFRVAHGLTVDSLSAINGILLVFLFAATLFYFADNRDPLFVWFGLLIVFCIVRNLNLLLPEWPTNAEMRNTIYLSATLGVLLSAGGFISRLSATRSTRLDALLIATWLPATVAIAIGLHVDMWGTWGAAITGIRLLTLTLGSWLVIRFLVYSRTLPALVQAATFARSAQSHRSTVGIESSLP